MFGRDYESHQDVLQIRCPLVTKLRQPGELYIETESFSAKRAGLLGLADDVTP